MQIFSHEKKNQLIRKNFNIFIMAEHLSKKCASKYRPAFLKATLVQFKQGISTFPNFWIFHVRHTLKILQTL